MFAEQLEKDNCNLLFFDAIRHLCKKLKSKEIELDSIINKKGPAAMRLIRKIIIKWICFKVDAEVLRWYLGGN